MLRAQRSGVSLAAAATALTATTGIAQADPDPHMPDLAAGKCVKGVSDMGMVKHCLGEPYADGTYWMENLWTTAFPVIGAQPYQSNGVYCVVGEYPNFVSPAPPGGCGGAA